MTDNQQRLFLLFEEYSATGARVAREPTTSPREERLAGVEDSRRPVIVSSMSLEALGFFAETLVLILENDPQDRFTAIRQALADSRILPYALSIERPVRDWSSQSQRARRDYKLKAALNIALKRGWLEVKLPNLVNAEDIGIALKQEQALKAGLRFVLVRAEAHDPNLYRIAILSGTEDYLVAAVSLGREAISSMLGGRLSTLDLRERTILGRLDIPVFFNESRIQIKFKELIIAKALDYASTKGMVESSKAHAIIMKEWVVRPTLPPKKKAVLLNGKDE